MKYTILYERLARVKEYETIKIGLHYEYDDQEVPVETAYNIIRHLVDDQITRTLRDLRK